MFWVASLQEDSRVLRKSNCLWNLCQIWSIRKHIFEVFIISHVINSQAWLCSVLSHGCLEAGQGYGERGAAEKNQAVWGGGHLSWLPGSEGKRGGLWPSLSTESEQPIILPNLHHISRGGCLSIPNPLGFLGVKRSNPFFSVNIQ